MCVHLALMSIALVVTIPSFHKKDNPNFSTRMFHLF